MNNFYICYVDTSIEEKPACRAHDCEVMVHTSSTGLKYSTARLVPIGSERFRVCIPTICSLTVERGMFSILFTLRIIVFPKCPPRVDFLRNVD